MSIVTTLIACLITFIFSIVGVSTGGTSLVTVPLLVTLGMTSKNAVASNMFALIFLSISGAIGFRKEIGTLRYRMIAFFSILTIYASFIGAALVVAIGTEALKTIVAVMICIIAVLFLFKKDLGIEETGIKISKKRFFIGTSLVFILGIYGGFFSGGYVTLLSYTLILTYGLNFLQTAFITKILNIFSSFAACIFFYRHGLIDFSVAVPLAISMFFGGFCGAKLAIAKGNMWIKNVFIVVAIVLAIRMLLF